MAAAEGAEAIPPPTEQGDTVPQPVGGNEPNSASSPPPKKEEEKALWLDAWSNRLAGVRAFSSCLALSDIYSNGDWKLLVADAQSKLKIFSGTDMLMENALLDTPCAICSFYTDYTDPTHKPAIAVASGSAVFTYKNFKPYYKFFLPIVEINSIEADVWSNIRQGKATIPSATDILEHAKENGVMLSSRSLEFLAIENNDEKQHFADECKNQPLIQQTVITAMTVLKKDKDDPLGVGYLVIGTENARILILDSQFNILRKLQLQAAPVFICPTGLYDVDYRICVACRNGCVATIKNGEVLAMQIELESQICGMVRVDKSIIVGTMANSMHSFHVKGKKQYSIYLPHAITNMEAVSIERARGSKACIVALANGEVRVYNGKIMINSIKVGEEVTGMIFGRYGREDTTLLMTTASGAVLIKILPRLATLEVPKGLVTTPPPEQDIPLKVPKKTRLYVEQTDREKDFGIAMHRVFQRDLCKLRLQTARAYVKILTDGQGPLSYTGGSSLRLTAHVQGLGPLFKIKLNIQNTGAKPLSAIPIVFTYNKSIYQMWKPYMLIPVLVPSLVYHHEVDVRCIDESAGSDVIRVYVCSATSSVPIITALVNMPLTDFLLP
eukprot:TRINITY_DN14263_c0_g1_i1.p1 TRINITY_DN14263_c0_g1~~TRINITY_DN14263_c0_g1_i1.p1  ORF type:complete len:631 (+),score=260.23 TRINITY_DN14263_c0_g1_i1:62-1894(+)